MLKLGAITSGTRMADHAHLQLQGIQQRYGSHVVVDDVSFTVETGSIACLLGPSGCGKTTLLRCIAAPASPWRPSVAALAWSFRTTLCSLT